MVKNMLDKLLNSGNISECCRGIRNTAGGYKWLFVDDI